MKKRKKTIINGYLKRIGIGILVSLTIVGVVCLIKSDYRNIESFTNGLFFIGGIEISAGFLSLVGNMKFRGSATYQVTRTAGAENSQRRAREDLNSTEKSFRFVLYMSVVGGLMIGISYVIQYLTL